MAHCGGSLAGDFIWSVTYTDILSGWIEGGAVWNKGAKGVLTATREMEARLPFALLGEWRLVKGSPPFCCVATPFISAHAIFIESSVSG